MKRFSIRVVCSIRSGEGSARGGCSKRSYCSEAAGHVTGEGEREGGEGRRSPLFLPTVSIPDDLQKALKKVLEPYLTKQLVSDGQVLYRHLMSRKTLSHVQESRRRRGLLRVVPVHLWREKQKHSQRETAESVLRYGSRETVAYATSRLQATYGATLRVLNEIAVRDPSFRPETMLDFGSGLGTTVWAAHQLWGGSLYETQTVDTSSEMGHMARRLRTGGEGEEEREGEGEGEGGGGSARDQNEAIPGVYFRQYLPTSNLVQYDVVAACYSLGDLPSHSIKKLSLATLWRKTKKYMVLIEPGNTAGFQNILEARDMVLDAPNWVRAQYSEDSSDPYAREEGLEGHVFAPCPHSGKCPLAGGPGEVAATPCRFGQRVTLDFCDREVLKHRGHKIESFSYVIIKKGREEGQKERYSRVLQPVKKRTKHVLASLCSPDGEVRQVVYTKSKHGSVYRQGRQSKWGDLLPFQSDESSANHLETELPSSSVE